MITIDCTNSETSNYQSPQHVSASNLNILNSHEIIKELEMATGQASLALRGEKKESLYRKGTVDKELWL